MKLGAAKILISAVCVAFVTSTLAVSVVIKGKPVVKHSYQNKVVYCKKGYFRVMRQGHPVCEYRSTANKSHGYKMIKCKNGNKPIIRDGHPICPF